MFTSKDRNYLADGRSSCGDELIASCLVSFILSRSFLFGSHNWLFEKLNKDKDKGPTKIPKSYLVRCLGGNPK